MNASSVAFYRRLAGIYDDLFPVEAETLGFLEASGAEAGRRVLDLACGSGLYTETLLRRGVEAWGVDGSPDLIELARSRSREPRRFLLADMRDIRTRAGGGTSGAVGEPANGAHPAGPLPAVFDLIFCIGNSISHLESAAEVRALLHSVAAVLDTGTGRIVLQYVDMDTISVGSVRDLPVLSFGTTRFERRYVRTSSDRIMFDAALVDERTGSRESISNDLLVLRTTDMTSWLVGAGFDEVEVRGGFGAQPVEASWVRVLSARRTTRSRISDNRQQKSYY